MPLILIKNLDSESKTYIAVELMDILYIKLQAEESWVYYKNGNVCNKIRTKRPKYLNLGLLGKSFLLAGKGMLINIKIIDEIYFNDLLKFKGGVVLRIKKLWRERLIKYLDEYHLIINEYKPPLRHYQQKAIEGLKNKKPYFSVFIAKGAGKTNNA